MSCPKFDHPSRVSIARDIYQPYLEEKNELKSFFLLAILKGFILQLTHGLRCKMSTTWYSLHPSLIHNGFCIKKI